MRERQFGIHGMSEFFEATSEGKASASPLDLSHNKEEPVLL